MVVIEAGQEFFYCGVQWCARERSVFGAVEDLRALVAVGAVLPVWRLGEPVGRA